MTLPLLMVLVILALFALFWGGGMVAQGYLYQQPADRMLLRAGGAALLVGGFLSFWMALDRRAPGKYDTFFEFSPYTTTTFKEFEAVRWLSATAARGKAEFRKDDKGAPVEKATKYRRGPGAKVEFFEDGSNRTFQLNSAEMMTVALVLKPDEGGDPVRYDAELKTDARTGAPIYVGERRFTEANGTRYVRGDQLGVLYVPSSSVVVLALAMNLLLFVSWLAAFWLILRFTIGHSLLLTLGFGTLTMLVVMPLLFRPNRLPKAPEAAALLRPELAPRGKMFVAGA